MRFSESYVSGLESQTDLAQTRVRRLERRLCLAIDTIEAIRVVLDGHKTFDETVDGLAHTVAYLRRSLDEQ